MAKRTNSRRRSSESRCVVAVGVWMCDKGRYDFLGPLRYTTRTVECTMYNVDIEE
jgi:hypothetical protein